MKKMYFLLFLIVATTSYAQEIEFKAIVPETVVLGEHFRLSYTINAEAKDLRIPEIPDFDILMGPSQSTAFHSEFINGRATNKTEVTFTYVLMPKKEGTFNIPPATIKVKNANYTSNALVVKVLPEDKSGASSQSQNTQSSSGISNNDVFLQMQVSKHSVYEQEPVLVTFKLFSAHSITQIANYKFPEFEGFLMQDIELPQDIQVKMENYNGKNYQTYLLKQALLYPQRSGKITIESGRIDAVMRVRSQQEIRSIFDDFFDAYQNVSKTVISSPATIDVKPLPAGKPASFGGGVGDFNLTASISSENVKSNEAITINLKISGTGNLRLIKNPEVIFPNDFDIYDPKVEQNINTTTRGVTGSKTIEYMAIPRYGGEFEIPAIQFSYFDLKSGNYKTLTSGPYKLNVEQVEGGEGNSPVVNNFSNRESVKYLGQDIRFLKVKGINFHARENAFFGSLTYYLCYLIPAILFIFFFIIYRKQVKENANIALVKTKKANKTAVKRLKYAGKLMKDNKKEAFYEEILRALWGYLSDKLSMPQSSLTKENVEAELAIFGVSEELTKEFMDILNTCEFARYAPSQAPDTLDSLYQLTVDAIGKMENTIKK